MKKHPLLKPAIISFIFFLSFGLFAFVGNNTVGRKDAIYTPADQDTLQTQLGVIYREIDAMESLPQGKAKYLKQILESASIKLAKKGTDTTSKK